MATIESGGQKYARKTAPGGPGEAKWNAAKGSMPARWVAGLQRAGITPGPISQQSYQSGIAAAQYRGGDPTKWATNLRESLSR